MKYLFKLILLFFLSSSLYGQGSLVWDFATKGGVYSSPVVDDSTVYIGSNDSCLYALDKFHGGLKWKFRTEGQIKSRPLLLNGYVIFNSTDGLVYSISTRNAEIQWQFRTGGEKELDLWDYYLSSPALSGDKLFVGSGDGNVYALDSNSGRLAWKFETGGIVHATPIIHNKKVYVGSFDGYFYALNSDNGELVWKFRTVGDTYFPKGEIQKGATIHHNAVIFGSRDYNIYALDVESGRGLWNMKEKGSWIIATPLVVEKTVFFGTSDSHRFCGVSIENGVEEYTFPLNMRVYGDAICYESAIYFGCFNGKLYRVDTNTHTIESIFQTHGSKKNYHEVYTENDVFKPDFILYGTDTKGSEKKIMNLGAILSTPFIDGGLAYFGDSNGVVYALRLN
ncbi:MAG: PQQ-binding-like beta-propeller repeat protein [Proteiniphilum sp.]